MRLSELPETAVRRRAAAELAYELRLKATWLMNYNAGFSCPHWSAGDYQDWL